MDVGTPLCEVDSTPWWQNAQHKQLRKGKTQCGWPQLWKQREENPGRAHFLLLDLTSYHRHFLSNVMMSWIHQWVLDEVRALSPSHFSKATSWHQASGDLSDSTQSMCVVLKGDSCLVPANSEWIKSSFSMQP